MQPRFGQGTRQCWRVARYVTPNLVNMALRLRTAAGLPITRGRFEALGLPDDAIDAILRHVTSLDSWEIAWTWGAQRFLGESRRHATARRAREAALARQHAALCFHAATIGARTDDKTLRTLRAARTTLFSQALPIVMPTVRRVEIVWRASLLPAYLAIPADGPSPMPLVVILNGSTTAKEETLLWATPLLDQGLAVLCLDWPGTGESGLDQPLTLDCDDIADGLLAFASEEPALSPDQVALVGFSLGGGIALRAAAAEHRIAAVVTVSAPFDPAPWLADASPVTRDHLQGLAGPDASLEELAEAVSVAEVVPATTCPLLVVGGGADLLLPPAESLRLAAAAGDRATLLWYPDEGHGLYDAVDDWTAEVGRWLRAIVASESTGVDAIRHRPRTDTTSTRPPRPATGPDTPSQRPPAPMAPAPRQAAPASNQPNMDESDWQGSRTGDPRQAAPRHPAQPAAGERRTAPAQVVDDDAPTFGPTSEPETRLEDRPRRRQPAQAAPAAPRSAERLPRTGPDPTLIDAQTEVRLAPHAAAGSPPARTDGRPSEPADTDDDVRSAPVTPGAGRPVQAAPATGSAIPLPVPLVDTSFSPLAVDTATFWDAMARGVIDTRNEAPAAAPSGSIRSDNAADKDQPSPSDSDPEANDDPDEQP